MVDDTPIPDSLLRIDGTMPLDAQRRAAEGLQWLATEPTGVELHDEVIGGVQCRVVRPEDCRATGILQYLHGGYAMCSLDSHRRLAGHVARATAMPVVLVGYRLAPEHPFPAALDDSVAVYRALLDRGRAPSEIGIAGESAGGALTLSTLVTLRDRGVPQPGAAAVMSPWTDLSVSGGSIETNAERDLFVQGAGLRVLARQVLGGTDPRHPVASPLFADHGGLSPLLVQVASDEVLLDDALRLVVAARAAGVDVALDVVEGMQHAFQLAAGNLPEADAALARLGAFFASRLRT